MDGLQNKQSQIYQVVICLQINGSLYTVVFIVCQLINLRYNLTKKLGIVQKKMFKLPTTYKIIYKKNVNFLSIRISEVQCLEIAFRKLLDIEYKHTTSNKTRNKISSNYIVNSILTFIKINLLAQQLQSNKLLQHIPYESKKMKNKLIVIT